MCIRTHLGCLLYSSPPYFLRQGPPPNLNPTLSSSLAGYLAAMVLLVSALWCWGYKCAFPCSAFTWVNGDPHFSLHSCAQALSPLSPFPGSQRVFLNRRLPWHLKEVCYVGKRLKQTNWGFSFRACCTVDTLVYSLSHNFTRSFLLNSIIIMLEPEPRALSL